MAINRTPTALQTSKLVPGRKHGLPPDQGKVDMLVESIRANGILKPLSVRQAGDYYEILNGEAVWMAAKQLGIDIVPVEVEAGGGHAAAARAQLRDTTRESISPDEILAGLEGMVEVFGKDSAETVLEQLPELLAFADESPEIHKRLNALLASCGLEPYA